MAKKRIILGVNSGHGDSSAALIVEGRLVAAAEEERFTRLKHDARFPFKAIQYCLQHGKVSPKQVEVVAFPRKPLAALWHRMKLLVQHPNVFMGKHHQSQDRHAALGKCLAQAGLKRASQVNVEHHFAHMMSARWLTTENVSLLSLDGLGDFTSAAMGQAQGAHFEMGDRVYFPHSAGFFYTALTHYLGFLHYGDEFKVMGLSSYGKPRFLEPLRELIREDKTHFGFTLNLEAFPLLKKPIQFFVHRGQPVVLPFYQPNILTQMLGVTPRKPHEKIRSVHEDLAKSIQVRFEEIANHLLQQLYDRFPCGSVALSGGCAHNSVWVGKIVENSPFRKVHVAPAAHDAGLAVGAAIVANQEAVTAESDWALMGPTPEEVSKNVDVTPAKVREQSFNDEARLIEWIIERLLEKKTVGLCHGRMEFGPRALGSRSILADPRHAEMKDKLNRQVKHRELFRPFAASVLWEHQDAWFENSFFSPYMEAVFRAKHPNQIAAAAHVDQTCRIQSVCQETQPFYYKLIDAFRKRTGIPMLINTSFNDREPIVCTIQDAWKCFQESELDCLVIDNRVYAKIQDELAIAV